jgi:hypothetical protein
MSNSVKEKLVWFPSKNKVNISNIDNPLSKKKSELKQFTIEELSDMLLANTKFREVTNHYIANNIQFNTNLIVKAFTRRLGDFFIPEEIQRLLDINHCTKILTKIDERLLQPGRCCTIVGATELLLYDGQHSVTLVAAMARLGLWEGIDPNNWQDMQFPILLSENVEESFSGKAAEHCNGKNSKPWGVYDYHRIHTRNYLFYNDPGQNNEYKLSYEKQKLHEDNNSIPLPELHPDLGKIGTFSHIQNMSKYKETNMAEYEFIVTTNNKYWNGVNDSFQVGFYGSLYRNFNLMNVPLTGEKFTEFMEHIHAIIKTFFTSPSQLRQTTNEAFKIWLALQSKSAKGTPPDNSMLAIVLKIYKRLGGKHYVTSDERDFIYQPSPSVIHDIYDSLPLSIRQDVTNYTI